MRRWWWLRTNWLLIGPHWQISHLHQLWHWLGANNVFVRRGRRMSGPCQRGALVRTRDNNGLVAANYVSKAIKVFLMFGQRWLWRDTQHGTGADTLRPRETKKKGRIPHILCPSSSSNAVSRLYKYFEKFLCKCWKFCCIKFKKVKTTNPLATPTWLWSRK